MADSRLGLAWNIASHQMALTYNLWRSADSDPLEPSDFNPMVKKEEEGPPMKLGIGVLKCFLKPDDPNKRIKPGEL